MHVAGNSHSVKDSELLARIARGQTDALALLVQRHQAKARLLAYRFTGKWELADDIAQEAFLRVWRAAGTYRPTASFNTWFYRIIANLCIDLKRQLMPMRLVEDEPDAQAESSVVQRLMRSEAAAAVHAEINALPERQRMAVILHRFEGMNHQQIQEITGWTQAATESLLVRAYTRLRERLQAWSEI